MKKNIVPDAGGSGPAFRICYSLIGLGFLLCAGYLSLRLQKYWGSSGRQFTAHCLALAGSVVNAALALRLGLSIKADDPRRRVFRQGLFWRYWLYAAAAGLIITCITAGPKPRELFRAVVVLAFTPQLAVMSSKRLYLVIINFARRGIGRALDLAAFNLVLLLLLLEGGLRLAATLTDNPLLSAPNLKAAKRIRDHKLRPGNLHLGFPANSQGFFDREFVKEKPAGTFRILGLADSFGVEGVGYQDNFLTLLEASLPAAGGKHPASVEVMNLSVDGISPRGYLYLLKQYYRPYHADFAIVAIFVGNDIGWLPQRQPALAFLRPEFWYSYFVPARLLALHREEARKAEAVKAAALPVAGSEKASRKQRKERPTFSRETFLQIERKRLPVCRKREYAGGINDRYAELNTILKEMQEETAGKLLVVLIPDEFQVNDKLWRELTETIDPNRLDRTRPQKEISAYCLSQGIETLDLLPALRAEKENPVYLLQNTHWNRRGHQIATREITARITEILAKQ